MSDALTALPQILPDAEPGDWSRALAERELAVLGRIAEAGLRIVQALEAQAEGGAQVVQGDLVLAFDRAARAVRHTFMLRDRVVETIQDREAGRAARKADLGAHAARLVRGAINDDAEARVDSDRARRLAGEAAERLRAEDVGDLFTRPFGEAVASLCRDLGLSPDWLALAQECSGIEAEVHRPPPPPGAASRTGATRTPEPKWTGPIDLYWLDANGNPTPAPRDRIGSNSS